MGSPAAERVEIIDVHGVVQRVVSRAEMRRDNLWHRNVAVFVLRTDGRLVVHQRAEWKDVHPSMWDVAFGGVPDVGEPDLVAAVRELAEEAGLFVEPFELTDLGSKVQASDQTKWAGRFYAIRTDAPLVPADGEVQQMTEVAPAEVRAWSVDHPLCPDVEPLIEDVERWFA